MRRIWRYLAENPDPEWVIFLLYGAGIYLFVAVIIAALALGWQP